MSTLKLAKPPMVIRTMGPRCAAITGWMRARRDLGNTRRELAQIAELSAHAGGIVPHTEKDHHHDLMANLWFMRAAHEYAAALNPGGNGDEAQHAFFDQVLLPICKKIIQLAISDRGLDNVRMDDGGLLAPAGEGEKKAAAEALFEKQGRLRINALWYFGLAQTAEKLTRLRDPAGGHFDRLAGRFRRSFPKIFWCDPHKSICSPDLREASDHGDLPEPDQLLVCMLGASPLPRTKQRQIVSRIAERARGKQGILVRHPREGIVESPLHLAWLALSKAAEDPAEARALIAPLADLRDQATRHGIFTYYRNGHPLAHQTKPDPLATAEVLGAMRSLHA